MKRSDGYPDYYLRHIGNSRKVLDRNTDEYGIDLTISLTRFGVLWTIGNGEEETSSGVPIVCVARHFEAVTGREKKINDLRQQREDMREALQELEWELEELEKGG